MEYTNTVLIVDDSEMITKVLSSMVKKAGYNVLTASDGTNALQFFDGREIDLVITDLNMPNMTGIGLIGEIRLKEYYRYIPAVLFIGDDAPDRQELVETSGATMLFDKTNIKDKIVPTIKKLLG